MRTRGPDPAQIEAVLHAEQQKLDQQAAQERLDEEAQEDAAEARQAQLGPQQPTPKT